MITSKFLSTLEVEQLEDTAEQGRGSWRLTSDFIYYSELLQKEIVVPKDFVTDFASVPRIPIIFDLLGDRANFAGIVHDYLYDKVCTLELDRKTCDAILKEATIAQGVSSKVAWCLYIGVRIGASSHFRV